MLTVEYKLLLMLLLNYNLYHMGNHKVCMYSYTTQLVLQFVVI